MLLNLFLAVQKEQSTSKFVVQQKITLISSTTRCRLKCNPPSFQPVVMKCRQSSKFVTSCYKIQARHQYAPDLNYAICLKRPQSACQVNFRKKEKKKIDKKSTKEKMTAVKIDFQVTYRRDLSVAAFATSVGKAQPQTEYKVNLENSIRFDKFYKIYGHF